MKKTVFLFIGFLLFSSFLTGQELQVTAHRGFWKPEGSAQNSIAALEHANRINLYGSEFDVHMTADDVWVIFHDDKIKEVEIQKALYSVIKDSLLSNGERIPTLREYLEAAKCMDIQLIFELKPHATPERNREAARASIELVNEKRLAHRTEYITFNLDAGKELIKLAPESKVYYLNGELSPQELKKLGFAGLDYHYDVLKKHTGWFTDAKNLGLDINVWTVNDTTLMREMISLGANFITTDIPVDALEFISTMNE